MSNLKDKYESLLRADETELREALDTSRSISYQHFGRRIRFYAPSFMYYKTNYFCSSPSAFPSISVTGSFCALRCKHCGGKILNTMLPARTPERLFSLCKKIKKNGGVGCLISGGCLPDGSVPLDNFVDAIERVKRDLGLTIVVHTGVIDVSLARRLREAGVDAALIDVIGSDETIREIYQLDVKVADYERSLRALSESGLSLVPHVLVGLHYGRLIGELEALQMITNHSPSAVIVIALMPIRGTLMEGSVPPKPEDIARVLVAARLMMPKTPLVLGCMRPKGSHRARTDLLALKSGVNAMAFPHDQTIKLADSIGLEVSFSSLCCSQIFEDIRHGVWTRQGRKP